MSPPLLGGIMATPPWARARKQYKEAIISDTGSKMEIKGTGMYCFIHIRRDSENVSSGAIFMATSYELPLSSNAS